MLPFLVLILSAATSCASRLHGDSWSSPQHNLLRRQSDGPFFGNDTNDGPYWLANILRQGKAPFHNAAGNYTGTNSTGLNSISEYQVFRNVKDFGARGKLIVYFEIGCQNLY